MYILLFHLQGGAMPNSFHTMTDVEDAKDAVKREIRKEMKIKEGAEKLREVTSDKKSLADVQTIVKKANNRLQELQQELNEINLYLLISNKNDGKGTRNICYYCIPSNC